MCTNRFVVSSISYNENREIVSLVIVNEKNQVVFVWGEKVVPEAEKIKGMEKATETKEKKVTKRQLVSLQKELNRTGGKYGASKKTLSGIRSEYNVR